MSNLTLNLFCLFAQANGGGAPAGGQAPPGGGIAGLILPLIPIFVLFYFLMIRPEKRKQAEHRALLDAIKKNDRVVTIGGIYGIVSNVNREADRVTIKVDEANNTKLDVTFSSIARVVGEEPAPEKT